MEKKRDAPEVSGPCGSAMRSARAIVETCEMSMPGAKGPRKRFAWFAKRLEAFPGHGCPVFHDELPVIFSGQTIGCEDSG
jgi:hypothetical protein